MMTDFHLSGVVLRSQGCAVPLVNPTAVKNRQLPMKNLVQNCTNPSPRFTSSSVACVTSRARSLPSRNIAISAPLS